MPIVTTSPKGQVVIPKKERDKLGLKPGCKVMVKGASDHIEIYPLPEDPVGYFCGIFKEGPSLTKALLKDRKEERGREQKKGARLLRSSGIPKKGR
jgi:AbrB family looped-hinge helix DNA binding protein